MWDSRGPRRGHKERGGLTEAQTSVRAGQGTPEVRRKTKSHTKGLGLLIRNLLLGLVKLHAAGL